MGNRAWLYLQSEQDGDSHAIEIASANNHLPTLWQILLATSEIAPANTTQRVFGDAASDGLHAPAQPARARLATLAAFVSEQAHDPDALCCRQLQGALLWFDQLLADDFAGAPCGFDANLDELSWLVDDEPDGFTRAVRQACNERWLALRERMAADDLPGVLKLLNVASLDDEGSWGWRFGLAGLDHPYFAEDEAPSALSFAQFEAEQAKDAAHLGDGLYRFEADGLWGIRVGREVGGAVLVAPRYAGIWPFEGALAAVLEGERFGLVDRAGNLVLPCVLEDLWSFAEGLAGARLDGLAGFIDQQGAWVISPRFDSVGEFVAAGQAPACMGEHWGVIDRHGEWVAPAAWDAIEWSDDLEAWIPMREGRWGLLSPAGQLVLEPHCQHLGLFDRESTAAQQWASRTLRIAAMTGENHSGLIDVDGKVLVPLAYSVIGHVEWLPSPVTGVEHYVRLLRCIEEDGWEQWFESVYDTRNGHEVLPFVHEVFGLGWADTHGWLCSVAPEEPSEYCTEGTQTGIARADGSWLHEPVYAWVGKEGAVPDSGGLIAEHWSRGVAVPAQRADDGTLVLLHADGRVAPAPVQAGTLEA